MFEDFFAAFRDRQSVKEIAVVNFLALFGALVLKKAANHKLIERLAEAPRTGKQGNHRFAFNQFLYHQGFIHKIPVFIDNSFKIFHADGDFFSFFLLIHRPQLLSQSLYPHFPCAPQETSCRFRAAQLSLSIVYWNLSKETSKKQKPADHAPGYHAQGSREARLPCAF